jgi:hypothetical protein
MKSTKETRSMMRKPEHPPLTLDALVKWLAAQRPDQEYIWQDPTYCLVGHYLRDHGSSWGTVAYSELPEYDFVAGVKPWTYGAALERAKTLALPPPAPAMEVITDGREPLAIPEDSPLSGGDRPPQRQQALAEIPSRQRPQAA